MEGAWRREEVVERLVQAVGGAGVREGPGLGGWALSAPLDAAGALGPFHRACGFCPRLELQSHGPRESWPWRGAGPAASVTSPVTQGGGVLPWDWWGAYCQAGHTTLILPVGPGGAQTETLPSAGDETPHRAQPRPEGAAVGGCSERCRRAAEGCGAGALTEDVGGRGEAPLAPPAACRALSRHVCLGPLTLFSVPRPGTRQNMEKAAVPSVTLVVGCGVSSLTLLMLIIIYVSVWRCCFRRGRGGSGRCTQLPGRG